MTSHPTRADVGKRVQVLGTSHHAGRVGTVTEWQGRWAWVHLDGDDEDSAVMILAAELALVEGR